MIPNDKQIKSLIKKIQNKVELDNKNKSTVNVVKREILEEEPSLEVFNEMKKRPHA